LYLFSEPLLPGLVAGGDAAMTLAGRRTAALKLTAGIVTVILTCNTDDTTIMQGLMPFIQQVC